MSRQTGAGPRAAEGQELCAGKPHLIVVRVPARSLGAIEQLLDGGPVELTVSRENVGVFRRSTSITN
jgi:hypothetical protein